MKTHRPHTALFAFATWLVVGCGSNLSIGDPAPAPATNPPSDSPNAPNVTTTATPLTPRPADPKPVPTLVPCPTGILCWANTDVTRNTFVSSWADATAGLWAVTKHGEVVHWDGVALTKRFQLAGTFDDALVWGTGPDNVYAFFQHVDRPLQYPRTTVVRLHNDTWSEQDLGGDFVNYRVGALRSVAIPRLGIKAIASSGANSFLLDDELKPKVRLPAVPEHPQLPGDEIVDASASIDTNDELSVVVLTKFGRIFQFTEEGPKWWQNTGYWLPDRWNELAPSNASTLRRGIGIAPGIVVRDTFEQGRDELYQTSREFVRVGNGSVGSDLFTPYGASTRRTQGGVAILNSGSILPHGRSVSYGNRLPSPDAPLVYAGYFCFSLGCPGNTTVDTLGSVNGSSDWLNFILPSGVSSVLASSKTSRYSVGAGGTVFEKSNTGFVVGPIDANWTPRAGGGLGEGLGTGNGKAVVALDAFSDEDVWVLDEDSVVRHYDGKKWSQGIRSPGARAMVASKDGLWVSNGGAVDGSPVLARWNAGKWTPYPLAGTVGAFARDSVTGDVWLSAFLTMPDGSSSNRLHRWDGANWSPVGEVDPFGRNAQTSSIVAADGAVWTGGKEIRRRQGGRVDSILCPGEASSPTAGRPTFSPLLAVGNEAWFVGRQSQLFHISAGRCVEVAQPRNMSVQSAAGVRTSDVWFVGYGTTRLFHWNGRTIQQSETPFDPGFRKASVTPLGHLWVGAEYGAVLRSAVPKTE
jgi:hypothetical protein